MLSKIFTLSALLILLMACTTMPAPTATSAAHLIIPTPPLTADPNATLLPILLPNDANTWLTYHDGLANFGLALPQQWRITPPDPRTNHPALKLSNFDTSLINNNCDWPDGLAQLAFTAWAVDPEQPTLDWIGTQIMEVQSLEAAVNGRYAGYLLTTDQQQLILRLNPTLIIQIHVTPTSAWQHPDVQNILTSLSAPDDSIDLPAAQPTSPIALPNFCQDAAHLYTGPGTHFAEIGLLFADESLPVIGFSHDGRWLKLLYPNAPNHTAWASLTDTLTTAGQPPIQPIQIQPGNS